MGADATSVISLCAVPALLYSVFRWGNPGVKASEVSRVGWYMGAYFGKTLKRQYAYSNSPVIRRLDRGHLQQIRTRLENAQKVRTSEVYKNKAGKPCYVGTKHLKATEIPDCIRHFMQSTRLPRVNHKKHAVM